MALRAPLPQPAYFPTIDQVASTPDGALPILPPMSAEPTITLAPNPSVDGTTYIPQDASNPYWDGVRAYENTNQSSWSIAPVVIPSELGSEVANPFRLTGVGQLENAPFAGPNRGTDQVGSVMVENWAESTIGEAEQAEVLRPSVSQFARARYGNALDGLWRNLLRRKFGPDQGLAFERVAFAPMVLDTAVTSPYAGLRIRSNRGLASPDRLEYIWSRNGKGPGPESRVDWIDTMFRTELGNEKAALISEIGMRALNPEINPNTVGFADMLVGAKAMIYNGKCTKISSIFLTHINTGPADRGLGTGHFSLEPGLLMRHQWSDKTYLHGEIKYRIPIAATANFAGDVLTSGWGISTIWKDSDQVAIIPTFELQTHSFLFGGRTDINGLVQRVDSVTALELFPGVRCAFARSAMGTWELGTAAGLTVADRDWIDTRMMFELRWLR